jgi:hypothetical protein
LIAVLGVGATVVVALAVLTPTVIVGDDSPGVRVVSSDLGMPAPTPSPAPTPAPTPRGEQRLPRLPGLQRFRDLRTCMQEHGFGLGNRNRATPPSLESMREAMKACLRDLPGLNTNP